MEERFITYILSPIIGICIGLAIVAFTSIFNIISETPRLIEAYTGMKIYVLLPLIGLPASTFIVMRYAEDKRTGCGTHKVLEAYHYKLGYIPPQDTVTKTAASALTIGFGGSAGLEGPSLLLGGGLASFIASKLKLKDIRIPMLVGAAAGLSAIFKAPLTAVLFALEIPYKRDIEKEVFVPAVLSAIPAYIVTVFLTGETPIVVNVSAPPLSLEVLIWSLLEGFLATAVAYLFVKFFNMVKFAVSRCALNKFKRALIGGCMLSLIWLFMPDAAGLGYNVISKALRGALNDDPAYAACLLLVKMTATAITLNFGGSGGLFIPSIFLGAMLGVVFSGILHSSASVSGLFVVVGMAAVLSATSKTLLTSVLFVAETCTPLSIIPATLASSISYFASGTCSLYEEVQLSKRAVEEEKALEELYHMVIEQNREDALKVKVGVIMNRNPIALQEDMTVKEVVRMVENYNFRVYPVVDERFRLIGFTTIEDILSLPKSKYDLKLSATLLRRPLIAFENEELGEILRKMIEYDVDHVYVVSDSEQMRLIGVVSGIDVVRFLLKYIRL